MNLPSKDDFAGQGFVRLRSFFSPAAVDDFEKQIIDLYAMQARKIGEYREAADAIAGGDGGNHAKISGLVDLLEARDKEAAYQVQKFLAKSPTLRAFFHQGFIETVAGLIGSDVRTTLLDGPALFVNKPTVNRLLYRWHTEALYYPKRRRFANVWLPIFAPRTVENGAMTVLPGSHKPVWDASLMNEYSGWDKDAEGKKNQFVQLEIPANFLAAYKPHDCVSEPGDAIVFNRNLVHTSNHNLSPVPAYAIVCRVWDPSDDLTISGDMEATPYGGNIGRANLIVRP